MNLTWLLAALCVAAMGFAIQRGGTCTVAAVAELLQERRARRLLAMLEAAAWVAGGLGVASALHLAHSMPAGFEIERWTVLGAALLGVGAWLNRACVFGAIARLGSGEWAYASTPLGFFAGCVALARWPGAAAPLQRAAPPLLEAAALAAPLLLAGLLWRRLPSLVASRSDGPVRLLRARLASPHAATVLIGITFLATLLLVGRWAYTDVLADLAHGMAGQLGGRGLLLGALLFGALLFGALLGGASAGRWRVRAPTVRALARCVAGGALMGFGSGLIPGSNDGLLLIGLPLLQPHAWLAFVTMCATIALAMRAQQAWAAPSTAPT